MKTFFCWKNSKFPPFKLYTVSEKMLYQQRYSTDFQKLSLCWKMLKISIWAKNIMGAAVLVFPWYGENFLLVEKFEISHFQAVHCVRENAISSKVFTRFSKTFLLLKDVENRYSGKEFHGRSYFSFAMVRWKLFSGKKFEISRFHALHFVRENAISPKVFNRFSKFSFRWKMSENRYLGQKFHGCSYFMFCNGKVKTFFWWKNSKFPTFKLYTLSEKMLYHQRYSADFQKLSIRWKMREIGICAKNFMGAAILVLQW